MPHNRGDNFSLNASVNEYVFARIIEDYNIDVRATGRGNYITAKEGKALHKQWLNEIAARPRTHRLQDGTVVPVTQSNGAPFMHNIQTIPVNLSREVFVSVFGPRLNEGNLWQQSSTAAPMLRQYFDEYVMYTGIALKNDDPAKAERLRQGVAFSDNQALPISPFDDDFADRETVLEHGTEILWAKPDTLVSQERNPRGEFAFVWNDDINVQHNNDYQFMRAIYRTDDGRRANVDEKTSNWMFQNTGSMATQADVSGISRLREFMNDREFRTASRWMERVPQEQRMTPDMTDRSIAILEMLRNNGIPYQIKTDQRPGQLKANIGNTKLSIRLTDTRVQGENNGLYIGRVYNDGNSITMSPRQNSKKRVYVPTIEDTLNIIKYGMGDTVQRRVRPIDTFMAGPVGSPSSYPKQPDGSPGKRTTYFSVSSARRGNPGKPQLVAVYGNVPDPTTNGQKQLYLDLKFANSHSDSHLNFPDEEHAESWLREAISTARDNFEQKINIDYLVSEFDAYGDDPNYVPILSGDTSIAPIQLTYWNVLKGAQELYMPEGGTSRDHSFDALFEALNLSDADENDTTEDETSDVETTYDFSRNAERYVGDPEDIIRAHLRDNVNLMFGDFEPDDNGIRFSPSLVASYMESAHGTARNKDNLVSAMRTLGFTGDELRGDDFETSTVKDKLLRFDEDTARPMSELAAQSPYMRTMFNTIVSTLRETACVVNENDIRIDNNGVVHYKAKMMFGQNPNNFKELEGQIGQIFEPDKDGILETKYNGSANKLLTPGYEAYIVPETDENRGRPLEERYRFRGLPQILHENIRQQLRYDVHNIEETLNAGEEFDVLHTGTTTSLNNTYRGLYHTGYKVCIEPEEGETLKDTYLRQMEMTHMPKEVLSAIFQTARGMVHFDKEILEGSSVNAEYRAELRESSRNVSVHELTNDNVQNPYELTNHANMAITAENSNRLFDPVMTGSGKNQGGIRYFIEGAGVNPDGTPHFAKQNGRAPIVNMADQQYADYIPADRQQMSLSNYMTAPGIAGSKYELDGTGQPSKGVGVAQLTMQGWTFDDGALISKAFAEKYQVIDDNGKLRPLMAGDKLCDQAGNKSTIAKVIDPDIDLSTLDPKKADGIRLAVETFKLNPQLDVIQAPYSPVSRFNGASVKHAMTEPADLILPEGIPNAGVNKGCIGFIPMTITRHTAEDHTKAYDDDAVKQGKGRKISTQQSWMLCAKGATAMMKEIFEPNNNAIVNMREYLNVLGYDMSETGKLRFGYEPHNGEERYMFNLPSNNTIDTMSEKDIAEMFNETVGARGGFMELPFPLDLPSKHQTQLIDKDKSSRPERNMYALPIMSSHLRSGQTFEDGTKATHDYTNQYQAIYKAAVSYIRAEREMDVAAPERKEDFFNEMKAAQRTAQQAYNSITDDVMARKFESKHNIARDELMARRMPNSATAIWTPDATLDINEIGVSPSLAKTLDVKDGDRILINRDPLLRVYGMRDMKVKIDNKLHGVSINPAIAVSFDGDFDGDSCGLNKMRGDAAKEESYRLFSFEQNMLDFARVRDNGDYALMFNDSMDVISAEAIDKENRQRKLEELSKQYANDAAGLKAAMAELPELLYDRRMRIEHEFNEVYRDTNLSDEERTKKNEELTKELSDYTRDVFVPQAATELVSYNSPQEHMQSLITMVDHGAKGSMKKLDSYMKYVGFTAEHDDDGRILVDTVKDTGNTLATPQDIRDTELATAIKSHGTGNAGAVSQRVVGVVRNRGLAADVDAAHGQKSQPQNALEGALRLSYLATQGILQAKHDPEQAKMLYAMINSDLRNLWKGYALDREDDPKTGIPRWKVRYENGRPIQSQPMAWVKTFMDMHTAKNGLDLGGSINIEDIKQTAAALTGPDGLIMNIEDSEIIHQYSAPIDVLAYKQADAKDLLQQMATEGTNLFDGEYSQFFAPSQIRNNIEAVKENRLEDLKPLQPADTKAMHNVISNKKSAIELNAKTVNSEEIVKGRDVASKTAAFIPEKQKIGSFDYSKGAKITEKDTEFTPISFTISKESVYDIGYDLYNVSVKLPEYDASGEFLIESSHLTESNGKLTLTLDTPTCLVTISNGDTNLMVNVESNVIAGILSTKVFEDMKNAEKADAAIRAGYGPVLQTVEGKQDEVETGVQY